MINILFIGGAGFIGSNLISTFVDNPKYKIYVYEPAMANLSRLDKYENKLIILRGGLSDSDLLSAVLNEHHIDIVVHLVSTLIPGSRYEDYKKEFESVIFPTIMLMKLCAERKTKFVYFSSGGTIYGNDINSAFNESDPLAPISYYGLSKQIIENSILFENRVENLNYLIVRPSNPYGPGQMLYANQGLIAVMIGKILAQEEIVIWGDGNSVRDYIYIDDLVDAFYQLINNDVINEVVNVGSGEGMSVNNVIDHLKQAVGREIDVRYENSRSVDVARMVLDISKLNTLIKVKHTPLEIGMEKFLNYIEKTVKRDA